MARGNALDGPVGNGKIAGNMYGAVARSDHLFNLVNLSISERTTPRLTRPPRPGAESPHFHCVVDIVLLGAPLKIFNAVVLPVPINVVDHRVIVGVRDECCGDKAVNAICARGCAQTDRLVTARVARLFDLAGRFDSDLPSARNFISGVAGDNAPFNPSRVIKGGKKRSACGHVAPDSTATAGFANFANQCFCEGKPWMRMNLRY